MALFTIRSCEIKLWRVIVLFIATSTLIVCGLMLYGRLNRPPSWQLRLGMTMQRVREIMGDPDMTFCDEGREEWSYRRIETIDLDFRNGRLSDAYDGGKGGYELASDP